MVPGGKITRKLLLYSIPLLIMLGIGFFILSKPLFNIDLDFSLIRREQRAVSVALLSEAREIFSFSTVEFVYNAVFPYDFLPEEERLYIVLDKAKEGVDLPPEDRLAVEIFNFCREINLNIYEKAYHFVVITALVKAGFDLEGTVYENPASLENPEEYVRINRDRRILKLKMPEPSITSFVIQDSTSSSYKYPDIPITPYNWKRLIDLVSENIIDRVEEEGILEVARRRGEKFLERFFNDAGFEKIIFVYEG